MVTQPTESSYGQILKSTTLVGGSQVINILIGIVRTKFMAMLLGPAGVGLIGMYQAVIEMVGMVTGLGIGSSGVRQIAEAAGSGDETRIARTVYTLRRTALFLGVIGMLVTMALSTPLSFFTFGNREHAWAIAVLGVTLLMGSVSSGQAALVRGMRRIADLASMSVIGAVLGTGLSVPIIYLWGEKGIVPSLLAVSAATILPSWWYARRIKVRGVSLYVGEIIREARGLVSLGLVFMASGVMVTGVMYLIRVLVVSGLGMESVGLYQSATTLSTMYIGIVLNAMGMDFYPRLTAVAEDNAAINRLVNEQTEVGLLIATPGLLITMIFAPYVIEVFYSARFVPAYEVLRWQILGIFLRVMAWPIGFVLLAKGRGRVFFWTELFWNGLHVGLAWVGLRFLGLAGVGMAFFWLYLTYTPGIFMVVSRISGFRWSSANIRIGTALMSCIGIVFLLPYLLSDPVAIGVNALLTASVTGYCIMRIYKLVGHGWFVELGMKLKNRLRFSKV